MLPDAIDPETWEIAAVREAAIRRLEAMPAGERTRRAVSQEAKRLGVSAATLFRLLSVWRANPVRSSLIPERRGPKPGSVRTAADKRQIIEVSIEHFYAKREAPRLSDLIDYIAARCRKARLTPPSRATIERFLLRCDQRRLMRLREGRSAADEAFAFLPGQVVVVRPLERVQVDHTLADVFVVDEETRLPLGRPYLTLAIDLFTRMVIGFHLTMDHPSALSVGLCLTQAVFDKGEWLNSRNVRHAWPCSGVPELLHVDNATEFHSRALARGCEEHGIKLEFRPKGMPHFGGHIERLIGTTMGALHLLPGTTRSSVADKRDYDPERHAALTLRQLERWIALEIAGKYHNKVHSATGRSPLAMWTESTTSIHWKLPADRTRFLIDFLPFEERILQKTGVQLFGFEYVSPQLRGHRGIRKSKLRVKYDPRDISRVWVEVGPGNFAEARWRQLGMPPMSKWERERSLKMLSARGRVDHDTTAITEAVLAQRAIEDDSIAQSRRARLKRHRREQLPFDQAVDHSSVRMGDLAEQETSENLVDGPLPFFDTEFFHGGRR